MSFTISDANANIINLITEIYSNDELNMIEENTNDINQLNDEYPIQCLRKTNSYYQAVYRGYNKLLILVFDFNGEKIFSKIYNISISSSSFDVLSVGQNIYDVQKIDSNGDYTFFYTGRIDVPRISYHYTSDGYIIQVTYNDDNNIISIDKKLI